LRGTASAGVTRMGKAACVAASAEIAGGRVMAGC